jgi:hypothetical protein
MFQVMAPGTGDFAVKYAYNGCGSLYGSQSVSNPASCGVNPHFLAVFTIRITLPAYVARFVASPAMVSKGSCYLAIPRLHVALD